MSKKSAVKNKNPEMPKRFPSKFRKKILQKLDKQEKRIKKEVTKLYGKMIQNPDFLNRAKESVVPSRAITVFDKDLLKGEGTMFTNPQTGKKELSRLSHLIWLEKGKVSYPDPNDTQKTITKEEYRTVTLNRDQVNDYLTKSMTRLKEVDKDEVILGKTTTTLEAFQDVDVVNWSRLQDANSAGSFLPFPPGPFTRQMYVYDQWLMLSRAAQAYNYNPFAKAGVDIKTAFIIGTGPRVIITNEKLKSAWDEFAKQEDFLETLRRWTSMLSQNGELFVECFPGTKSPMTVRSIDPGTVYDIITEPRDIRTVYGLKLMYQTQYQIFGQGAKGESVPLSEWIYETIAPDNIIHLKVNIQENEKRGRSDLLNVLWVVTLLEDYVRYKVIRAMVECAFSWDLLVKNGDDAEIASFMNSESMMFPAPNSTFVHNETMERKPFQFSGAASQSGSDSTFEMLLTLFSVGIGIPKEYMGAGSHGSRASAITSTEPSVKSFESRRQMLESLIIRLIDYMAGFLGIVYDSDEVEIAWPEIAPENASEKIANIFTLADRKIITLKRAAEMATKEIGITNYDFEDEIQEILQELTKDPDLMKLYQLIQPMIGTSGEKPGNPAPEVPPAGDGASAKPAVPGQDVPGDAKGGQTGPTSTSNVDRNKIKDQHQQL